MFDLYSLVCGGKIFVWYLYSLEVCAVIWMEGKATTSLQRQAFRQLLGSLQSPSDNLAVPQLLLTLMATSILAICNRV